MFGWFGRKGAPETVACGYAPPPWLAGACEEGFARGVEGLRATDKASGEVVTFRGSTWEKGQLHAGRVSVAGNQVLGARLAAVADPAGGTTVDAEARAAIALVLARLREHGLIAS